MQTALLRSVFALLTAAAAVLTVRELIVGSPALAASLAALLGGAVLTWSYRARTPPRLAGTLFFCALVVLITRAALDMGGARGSGLSFAFLPGFLAMLTLGPALGWGVCGLMLLSFGWLFASSELPTQNDLLRFIDEIAMTVFAAGLAHALDRSFARYEAAIRRRQDLLLALRGQRSAMTAAIYDELEPLSTHLNQVLESQANSDGGEANDPAPLLERLLVTLASAKKLAEPAEAEAGVHDSPGVVIRTRSMRVWLRLAAVLEFFFLLRNVAVGAPFAPLLITIALCGLFDWWLSTPAAKEHLEFAALTIGLGATGPLLLHVYAYGPNPDSPPLVVAPGTVLFTALLSQGPAAWAVLSVNVAMLASVGAGTPLTLVQSRLLGDLVLIFAVVVVALLSVFRLRQRYLDALLAQEQSLIDVLRRRRRVAGTLFHDVSNHLQTLMFLLDDSQRGEQPDLEDPSYARAIGRRVTRLIASSKNLLLSSEFPEAIAVESITVGESLSALRDIFRPRLSAKGMRLEGVNGLDLTVLAPRDLLVESVLVNLVSNAIKFSPPGSVITVSAKRVGDRVSIVVADTGPGVPKSVIERLGGEGAVPSSPGTAGEQGQGYGLQLVEEHLGRMGGRLEIVSSPEKGTEAVVWLPSGDN